MLGPTAQISRRELLQLAALAPVGMLTLAPKEPTDIGLQLHDAGQVRSSASANCNESAPNCDETIKISS